jgi:hypothetical protein
MPHRINTGSAAAGPVAASGHMPSDTGCALPPFLVQVRMQSEGKLAAGAPKKYPNAVRAYGIILRWVQGRPNMSPSAAPKAQTAHVSCARAPCCGARALPPAGRPACALTEAKASGPHPRREEGLLGLWKGLGPNIARNAIINAAELASYDQIKQSMLASGIFSVGCAACWGRGGLAQHRRWRAGLRVWGCETCPQLLALIMSCLQPVCGAPQFKPHARFSCSAAPLAARHTSRTALS